MINAIAAIVGAAFGCVAGNWLFFQFWYPRLPHPKPKDYYTLTVYLKEGQFEATARTKEQVVQLLDLVREKYPRIFDERLIEREQQHGT